MCSRRCPGILEHEVDFKSSNRFLLRPKDAFIETTDLLTVGVVAQRSGFFETVLRARTSVGGGSTRVHLEIYELLPPVIGQHTLFGLGLNTFSSYYEFVTDDAAVAAEQAQAEAARGDAAGAQDATQAAAQAAGQAAEAKETAGEATMTAAEIAALRQTPPGR